MNAFCWNLGYYPGTKSIRGEDSSGDEAVHNKKLAYDTSRPVVCVNGLSEIPDTSQEQDDWFIY